MTDFSPSFQFVALYCSDIHISKKFYEDSFSLKFKEEKHGSGPMHFSVTIGCAVLELYPAGDGNCSRITLGMKFSDFGIEEKFIDPDGNIIFVS